MESERNYSSSEKLNSPKTFYEGITKKLGRAMAYTALIGSSLASSLSYAVDQDRDGVLDSDETNIYLTDPAKADTDGDGVMDATEVFTNPTLNANALDFDSPTPNKSFYEISNAQELMAVDNSAQRIMPRRSKFGTKVAYIKTDTDYSNARLVISNLSSPSEQEVHSLTMDSYANLLGDIDWDVNDENIFFTDSPAGNNNRTDLYRYNLASDIVTKITNNVDGQFIGDAAIIRLPQSSVAANKDWLVYVDANHAGSGVSRIAAVPYDASTDTPNFASITTLVNLTDLPGIERWPKMDADGKKLGFSLQVGGSSNNVRGFIANDLENILAGNDFAVTSTIDPRIDGLHLVGTQNFVKVNGISRTGFVVYYSQDMNESFDLSVGDFSVADFDLHAAVLDSGGNVIARNRMALLRNQPFADVSRDSTGIIYTTDHDYNSATNSNLHTATIDTASRLDWTQSEVQGFDFVLEAPNGVAINLNNGSTYTLPGASPNGTIRIRGTPITSDSPVDGIAVKMEFTPSGATFAAARRGSPPPIMKFRYADIDAQELGTAETEIPVYKIDPNTNQTLEERNILNRDTDLNEIDAELTGFSSYALVSNPDADQDLMTDSAEENYDNDPAYNPYHPVNNPTGTDTDKNNPDTDGDGVYDGIEVALGTDPLDPFDFPVLSVNKVPFFETGNKSSDRAEFMKMPKAKTLDYLLK